MFKTHFLSHDQVKVNFFKKYSNKLSKIKELAKQTYFSTQFYLNKEDIKMTWKLIGMIINRKKKSNIIIPKLLHNNRCYTDKQSICEQLNTYFINVGPTLSAQLPIHRNSDPSKYIRRTFSNSFFFSPIHKYEVRDLIVILKGNKSTIGSPIKCVKYAWEYISHWICQKVPAESVRTSQFCYRHKLQEKLPSPPLCFGQTTNNHLPTPQCGFTLIGDQKQTIIEA